MKPRLVLALAVALFALTAQGHEFKMDALINAFVRIDGNEAHVVVRAPLFLLGSARFPVKNIEIDVASATAALDRSAGAIAQSIVLYENGRAVVPTSAHARLSLPSDRSFETYEGATAHVAQPPAADTQIYIDQGYVDAHLVYPIAAPESVFSVRTMAARELGDYVKLAVRYMPARGDERALLISSRSGMVDLNPTWWGAAAGFVGLGIAHILTGIDHLLFLLCLLIPLRSWRPMVAIVTTFTIAHSFTLIGAAFGLAPSGSWFPPFVESAIPFKPSENSSNRAIPTNPPNSARLFVPSSCPGRLGRPAMVDTNQPLLTGLTFLKVEFKLSATYRFSSRSTTMAVGRLNRAVPVPSFVPRRPGCPATVLTIHSVPAGAILRIV